MKWETTKGMEPNGHDLAYCLRTGLSVREGALGTTVRRSQQVGQPGIVDVELRVIFDGRQVRTYEDALRVLAGQAGYKLVREDEA